MAGLVESETIALRPMGQGEDEILEVRETETAGLGDYVSEGSHDRLVARPKTADDATKLRNSHGELLRRNWITIAGIVIVGVVTIIAGLTFLGLTNSSAPSAHEDAKGLLYLVIGAVLGSVFGAVVTTNKDPS